LSDSVAVIGGGIAGVQAALDLANASVHVFLVEKTPSLGGRMAQLDKTFPTNDCAMCILSPKLVEVQRHPNIEVLVNSEVVECKGKEGNFKVKVKKHARYVDEKKCTGCGVCAEKCPKKVSSEFDMGMTQRKAIYTPFPQAVPLIYTIDAENCTYFQKGKCRLCEKNCKSKAIDFKQKDTEIILNVGSIIVATGYDQFNPNAIKEYGFELYQNVITALEFERLLNASGPTEGRILRPSDSKVPKSITYIQCVGSRDENHYPYCSRVCCTYTVKEAMLAREHEDEIKEQNILYMDMRTFGKGFEEYYIRCRDEAKVNFIRGRSSEILEEPESKSLLVRYEDTEKGAFREITSDMVVLSSALIPSRLNEKLSEILGIDLDENGFFKEGEIGGDPIGTSRKGIFICGCAQGPKDIPDSVAQASAASAKAQVYVKERLEEECVVEDTGQKGRVKEEEAVDIEEEEPRIGIFVCHCGINIGGVIDVKKVVDYAKNLPYVVEAQHNLFTCSESTQSIIEDTISKRKLNRVIVAACTPRTHEPLFRETCEKAGLNPYLFEMTNIREHCSWVHSHEKEKATEKAQELLRMAVAKSQNLRPLSRKTVPIEQKALVVGGGIAGICAALDISNQGIPTILVEKQPKLGGRLNDIATLSPINSQSSEFLNKMLTLLDSSKVKVHKNCYIENIEGFVGNFDVTLKSKDKKSNKKEHQFRVGAIVMAIGAEEFIPKSRFFYGKYPNIITNYELEKQLSQKKAPFKNKKVSFILCVGARERDGNRGCSRYCCQVAIKQALELAENKCSVTVLYRDIRTFGKGAEEMYKKAALKGVDFIRYDEDRPPAIQKKGKFLAVYDTLLQEEIAIDCDNIVLVVPMAPPSDAEKFQDMLKIPRSEDGFFLEQHPKLAPLQTNTEGIFLCGCAQAPKNLSDTIAQASGAASQAIALLSRSTSEVEAAVAKVDENLCWGCGTCTEVCEFGAPGLTTVEEDISVSQINEALCKGCGTCAVLCPSGAITPLHFTRNQILSMIQAFGGGSSD
jgi:heterodisulfide reductase subunit A